MTAAPQNYDEVLPNPGFEITQGSTAIVITDPQVDFLSKDGVTWAIVGPSVEKNGTLENLCVEAHMRDLIEDGFEVAIAKDATAGAVLPKGDAYGGCTTELPHDRQLGTDHRRTGEPASGIVKRIRLAAC